LPHENRQRLLGRQVDGVLGTHGAPLGDQWRARVRGVADHDLGQPAELAKLVSWLASERCSFRTGAGFDLSGGRAVY
jgi:NAD(P)-dependent dehydrogenase (short-subunit alcohol dehydrogenase family)